MGTTCAPFYANIFMADFGRKQIYPFIKNMSMPYLQYIDDIFMIMERNMDLITSFSEENCKILKEEIAFLDTKIYIDDNKNVQTTVSQKEADC